MVLSDFCRIENVPYRAVSTQMENEQALRSLKKLDQKANCYNKYH